MRIGRNGKRVPCLDSRMGGSIPAFRTHTTRDYVLSGGEIPAITIINGLTRLLPGTLGDPNSLIDESHNSNLLEYPQYTRPQIFKNMKVPDVLINGNHKEIELWREEQMLKRTLKRRKDLIKKEFCVLTIDEYSEDYWYWDL